MTLTLSGRPWYLENVNRHCLAALVKADWGRDSESFHLLPLQFCKKAFPPCQTLIIYALLGNERRGETRGGKHPEPVPSCRAFGMGSFSEVTGEQKCGEITFVQGLPDRRPALRPPPQLRWVDAAGRGGVKGHPQHEYLQRFWITPPSSSPLEASPARLPWGEPPGLKKCFS